MVNTCIGCGKPSGTYKEYLRHSSRCTLAVKISEPMKKYFRYSSPAVKAMTVLMYLLEHPETGTTIMQKDLWGIVIGKKNNVSTALRVVTPLIDVGLVEKIGSVHRLTSEGKKILLPHYSAKEREVAALVHQAVKIDPASSGNSQRVDDITNQIMDLDPWIKITEHNRPRHIPNQHDMVCLIYSEATGPKFMGLSLSSPAIDAAIYAGKYTHYQPPIRKPRP